MADRVTGSETRGSYGGREKPTTPNTKKKKRPHHWKIERGGAGREGKEKGENPRGGSKFGVIGALKKRPETNFL